MKASRRVLFLNTLFFISFIVVFRSALGQPTVKKKIFENAATNHQCFKCHGHKFYSFYNDVTEKQAIKRMNPFYVIDSVAFYHSNHHNLECTDCHDTDYGKFPHNGQLQMEEMPVCLDCHEGDDITKKFHFEEINKEFKSSVHVKMYSNFTCAMCHDPHKYIVTARRDKDIHKIVIYDNEMCLSCHSKLLNYKILSDSAPKNITITHSWLPNQLLHFKNVRCLDCHVEVLNDSMVNHKILPKEDAVKNCVECHSQNTILMASLYKFKSKQQRSENGFLNATILNNSFVISANSNPFLNKTSIVIFALVILVAIVHAILRIILK